MYMVEINRRRVLQSAAAGTFFLAGCTGGNGDGDDNGQNGNGGNGDEDVLGDPEYTQDRPEPGGTSMDDMADLEGEIVVYSGRSQPRVGELMIYLEERYEDFTLNVRYDDTDDLINTIEVEDETPADVFYGSDSQSMTFLKDEGYTTELPDDVLDLSPEAFRDPDGNWTSFTRRFRALACNPDMVDVEDMPDDIFAYAEDEEFQDDLMWAADQGSFQAFVTAMRVIHSEDETFEWLQTMVEDQNIANSPGGDSGLAEAVGAGEVSAGFTNHYTLRDQPEGVIELAFTDGDAGAMFNVTGATVIEGTEEQETAEQFVAHLLSAEAQEYFATTTWEYPSIEEVEPIEEVPGTDEFSPPEFDLNELAELEETLDLLNELGIET
jgi:iron(III) transport system substrate-binding protein